MKPRSAAVAVALVMLAAPAALAQNPPKLTLAEAQKMIDAGHKAAADMNLRLTIAVVDARGDVIALGRMAGAGAGTVDTAIGKAMMSAIYGLPSVALVARGTNPTTQMFNDLTGGRLRFLQGGVPIVRSGFVVGAVAGSGATAAQDEQAAMAGLAASQ